MRTHAEDFDSRHPSERVELLLGGKAHGDWEDYEVESDLLTPADAWRVTLGLGSRDVPASVYPGAEMRLQVGGEPAMVGHIDEVAVAVGKGGRQLRLSGRDNAAALVDCSAPILDVREVSLDEAIARIVRPLGLRHRIDAEATRRRERVTVTPGDTAWQVVANLAEANGLWAWCEPDGTLVIGGPDYSTPPVATLILKRDGRANNLLQLDLRRSIVQRYSELTVLGQRAGTHQEEGLHGLRYTAKDTSVPWYRPRVVVDHEADTPAVCRDRARKLLADSRLKAFVLRATVRGHRIDAEGTASDGTLWRAGQRVRVVCDVLGAPIDDIYYVMERRFTGGRREGPRTHLTMVEDGVWTLDAHPHKRRRRHHDKNDPALTIPDLSKGAP